MRTRRSTRRTRTAGDIDSLGTWVWPLLLAVYAVGSGFAVWSLPPALVSASLVGPGTRPGDALTLAERAAAITAARQVVLLAAGGLLAVITLALTQRRDAVARARHEIERDANRTTRYTEAVKQLGDDKAAVRFGGIYALGRIAEDSERDQRPILEVLMAYIREAAPVAAGTTGADREEDEDEDEDEDKEEEADTPDTHGRVLRGVTGSVSIVNREDVRARDARELQVSTAKAAVEVVGRISRITKSERPSVILSRTRLANVNLAQAVLPAAGFEGADLTRADLGGADLVAARFTDADLEGAVFFEAMLMMADLTRARAPRAAFSGAQANSAAFADGVFTEASFRKARLTHVQAQGADFTEAVFDGANLDGANLSGCTLVGASFVGASLRDADLTGALTSGTSFQGADLRGLKWNRLLSELGDTTGVRLADDFIEG